LGNSLLARFMGFWKTPVGSPAFSALPSSNSIEPPQPEDVDATRPDAILADTRKRILAHAAGDPDKWFYANRFVFARLQLDERKTKVRVKKHLFDSNAPCHRCGKSFESRVGVHLHRLDGEKGYSRANCVLMHGPCHIQHHADAAESGPAYVASDSGRLPTGVVSKLSKRYEEQYWLYWWDISPSLQVRLGQVSAVEFVQKDTGVACLVETVPLLELLTVIRQTTRGQGNWGVRVLRNKPDQLAIESSGPQSTWPTLPATWLDPEED